MHQPVNHFTFHTSTNASITCWNTFGLFSRFEVTGRLPQNQRWVVEHIICMPWQQKTAGRGGSLMSRKLTLYFLDFHDFEGFLGYWSHSQLWIGMECCVVEPLSIKPLIAGSTTHDSFSLSSKAVPSAQLQTPEYLTTCIPVFWALLLWSSGEYQ